MKKAQISFNMIAWLPKLFFLLIVIFSIMILVMSHITWEVDTADAQMDIFMQQLLYSRNSLAYVDPDTDRVYPGIVDLGIFEIGIEERLSKSVFYGEENRIIAAEIVLKDLNGNVEEKISYNPEFFAEKKVLLEAGWPKGKGGIESKQHTTYVLIKNGTNIMEGILNATIILQPW